MHRRGPQAASLCGPARHHHRAGWRARHRQMQQAAGRARIAAVARHFHVPGAAHTGPRTRPSRRAGSAHRQGWRFGASARLAPRNQAMPATRRWRFQAGAEVCRAAIATRGRTGGVAAHVQPWPEWRNAQKCGTARDRRNVRHRAQVPTARQQRGLCGAERGGRCDQKQLAESLSARPRLLGLGAMAEQVFKQPRGAILKRQQRRGFMIW